MDALAWHRFQFGFTSAYHYLFPQLTMGLAFLIVIFKFFAMRTRDSQYNDAARFWARIFGLNFAVGVVTGIPLEFQFGTNWAGFSNFSGGVIGLTLAMEGMFAFFAESAFLGLFLYGEKRLSPKQHFGTAFMLFLGSWLSGYFIITTNAFMQRPLGYAVGPNGNLQLSDVWAYLLNPWALWQYAHTMTASVVTASFVVAGVGAFYALSKRHAQQAALYLKVGVTVGLLFSLLQIFPTGDGHGKQVAKYQPTALAAMEGKFKTGTHAEMAIIGQPDVSKGVLENPVIVPGALSYLAYGSFGSEVKGLDAYPKDQWPNNIELLYFCYHMMVGLGTLFILVMGAAAFLQGRGILLQSNTMLWVLMLAWPFPYIATTAGWMTTELGRQPWLVYGLLRTMHGTSPLVSGGDVAFSILGFMGMYLVLSMVIVYSIFREIAHGPGGIDRESSSAIHNPHSMTGGKK